MPSADESKAALTLVTRAAVETAQEILAVTSGSPEARRAALLDTVPTAIGYFAEGSAALAADFYDEERARAGVRQTFTSELTLLDRTVKIRRGIAWSAEPLTLDDVDAANARLAQVVQLETARPYRDTILGNRRRDPAAVGWTRIASPTACGFCRLLASKGAVFRQATARFAAHDGCDCTAAPVFKGGEMGPEADALQYIGSKRRRTPAEKVALRDAVAHFEGR